MSCEALEVDGPWHFCPSFSASVAFTVIFALVMIAHAGQAIFHKKLYNIVVVFSAFLQLLTYIFRDISIQNPEERNPYTAWFIIIMVAPIFLNAYAYMVQGRMTYNFTETGVVMKVPAWRFSTIFVGLDIIAFLIQIAGAGIAAINITASPPDYDASERGIHIYMAGIAFQQVAILIFLSLAINLHIVLRKQPPSPRRKQAFIMLYSQYAVVGLITGRIIFRMIEYSDGLTSTIPDTEWYQYVFDSTFMLIALLIYNVFNPARVMPGKESDLPSKKERKQAKAEGRSIGGRALVQQIKHNQSDSDVELAYTGQGHATQGRPY